MKRDQDKTKEQLMSELKNMRQRTEQSGISEVERNQAEKALPTLEGEYLKLFEALPIGITILNIKGVILYCNATVYREAGYPEGGFTGKHFSKIASVRVKDIPKFTRMFSSIVRGKIPKPFEVTYQRKDGTIGWTEITIDLMKVEGKRRILVVQHDITERKQAEEEIAKFKTISDRAGYGAVIANLEGQFIYVNESYAWMHGYRQEELIGKSWQILYRGNEAEVLQKKRDDLLKTGNSWVDETWRRKKDGTIFPSLTTGMVINDAKGKHLYIAATAIDITEQKQAEEEIKKFKKISDSASYGVAIGDLKGTLSYVNLSFARMHGYRPVDMVGKHFSMMYTEEQMPVILGLRDQLMQTGMFVGEEIWHKKKDGSIFPTLATGNLLNDDKGNPSYIVGTTIDITERKKAEEEYERIFNLSPDMVGIFTTEGELVKVNPSWETILDYKTEELLKMGWTNLVHPDDVERTNKEVEEQLKGRSVVNFTNRYKCKDGSYKTLEWQATFAKDGIVYATARDSTERKKAEEEVAKFKTISDRAGYGASIASLEGQFIYVNDSYAWMHGYKAEDLIGKPWQILYPEDQVAAIQALRDKLMEKGGSWVREIFRRKKDGTIFPSLTTGMVINDAKGKHLYIAATAIDITEQKQAEESLRESENRFRISVETLLDGFAVFSAIRDEAGHIVDFRYDYINEAGCRLNKWTYEEQIGHTLLELLPAHKDTGLFDEYVRLVEIGQPLVKESVIYEDVFGGGKRLTRAFDFQAVKLGDGFAVDWRDITERKQAEEREKQLQEELTMTSRLASVGEMSAGIAHEINNPLTGVLGFSSLLLQKDLPEEVRKDVNIIYEGAKRVASITRRMLAFARQQKQEKVSVNINDIIETTLEMRTYAMDSSNIKLVKQLERDLPRIIADAGQLQQVFLNIILNAETEMVQAHQRGNLLVKTEKTDNTIRITFKDDGPGIPEENLGKVFDPFFTTREVGQGAGLGLSVSHGIVTQHGGRIYAESKPGKGATFVVELPIVIKDEQLEMEIPTTEVPKAASRARVLVVDDEPVVRQYLNGLLTGEGYEVQVVDNANAALMSVRNHWYDVILLDIKMPGTDGIDLYKHLQKTDKSAAKKVIFITGDVMDRDTMAFLSRTKAPYIAKPFDAGQLKREVGRILDRNT